GEAPPAREIGHEAAERAPRRRRQIVAGEEARRRLAQRQLALARQGVHQLQARIADAAPRRVDDALEGEIVGRLVDDPEIRQRVADLLALVEARAADDAIGN